MQKLCKTISFILILALLINLCPAQTLASTFQTETAPTSTISTQDETLTYADSSELVLGDAAILAEVVENRTEFSKEYKLTNGMNMKVVYPESVHYAEDGQWKDIDNTLKLVSSGSSAVYTNTADSWQVSFPRNLTQDARVTVSSGGYTIHFRMAGALKKSNNIGTSTLQLNGEQGSVAVQAFAAQNTVGQSYSFDYSAEKTQAKYPEAIRDKLRSRMTYSGVYDNTSIIYDLTTQQLKESIVIARYDVNLIGYRYVLNTGSLVPHLNDDGSIDLLSPETKEVILSMPAPYMIDDAGEVSYDVSVALEQAAGEYVITYQMPMRWLADSTRAWPVVLDPIIERQGNYNNIMDVTLKEKGAASYSYVSIKCGRTASEGAFRAYVQFDDLPELPYAATVVDASIALFKPSGCTNNGVVEVHEILGAWDSNTVTWSTKPAINNVIADYASIQNEDINYWNITGIVQKWYETGIQNGVVFKVPAAAETATTSNYCEFWSSDCGNQNLCPTLYVVFRDGNGLEGYWDYTTASAGRAGTGYVNNYTGNLTWIRSDLGFGGNRMPVSISHIYNTNDCDTNNFGVGYGWKTNYNQLVARWTNSSNTSQSYYYWEDGDGTRHYFVADSEGNYVDEDGLELTLDVKSNGTYTITDEVGNTSNFDSKGRLTSMVNNQATQSSITIAYTSTTSKMISQITDGAGRKYNFTYTNNLLSKITYIGSGTAEITSVTYAYDASGNLTTVTDKDSGVSTFTYSNHLLSSAADVDGYKLKYTYSAGEQKRVVGIAEYDGTVEGSSLSIAYGNNETRFTDHDGHTQILQFNDWGNVTSIQDDQGRAQFSEYAKNAHKQDAGKVNQLTLSSKLQNTVGNQMRDGSFELGNDWTVINTAVTSSRTTETAFLGNYSVKMTRTATGAESGIRYTGVQIETNKTLTLSGYVKTGTGSVRLAINDGTTTVYSEPLAANSDWTRLQVSYTNNSSTTKTINLRLVTSETGTAYLDAVQLEYAVTASRYNFVSHNDFRSGGSPAYAWTGNGLTSNDKLVTAPSAAAPELEATAFYIVGSPTTAKSLSQTVNVTGSAGDAYVLAGWAMADSAPLTDENRTFALKAEFQYTDGTESKPILISFNSGIGSSSWQYAADAIVAQGAYNAIIVSIDYSHNVNTAYFDGIQLFREKFGADYEYYSDGKLKSVTDLQEQITQYNYTNGDLTQILQNGETEMTYEYDSYHNVKKATDSNGLVYTFTYDTYGNNLSVSITNGTSSITTSATYTTDGNRLATTTDATGQITTYQYNANTGVLEWVQNPQDTAATRTQYTYDTMYRLATAAANVSTGGSLNATYTYVEDLLTQITTNSTTYTFNYGDFAQTSNIMIGTWTLATYSYTSVKNRYLEKLDYGNQDSVKYTYDEYGRVTQLVYYEDGSKNPDATITYRYDNNGDLASILDSASGMVTRYLYDEIGRTSTVERKVGDVLNLQIKQGFDNENRMTGQTVKFGDGSNYTTTVTYNPNDTPMGMVSGIVGTGYTYDGFVRVTQIDSEINVLDRQFTYRTNPNTSQITQLKYPSLKGGYAFHYTYDNAGNISGYELICANSGYSEAKFTYQYDSQNQLIRATDGTVTFTYSYDDAGNILTANGHTYTYGNADWGDLLTAYDGKSISYDGVGNPLSYNGWNFTWKKGRQLAAATNGSTTVSYTYDADGLRTSKTVNGVVYTYYYVGSQLARMTYGDYVLDFFYDANGTPIAMRQGYASSSNYTVYYYITNLQGDVIRLVDVNGSTAAYYEYDPYGNAIQAAGSHCNINPLRYRGYVYDQETGYYYLQSRYYNPEWGRFLNADDYQSTGQGLTGNNMFAYCGNNPVCRADDGGEAWFSALIGAVAGAVIGAAAELASQFVNYVTTGEAVDWGDVLTSAAGGAVYGGVFVLTGSDTTATMAATATESVINGIREGDSIGEIIVDTAVEISKDYMLDTVGAKINKTLSNKGEKLGPIGKMVKKLTADPYQGKYASGPNRLADSLSRSVKRARDVFLESLC